MNSVEPTGRRQRVLWSAAEFDQMATRIAAHLAARKVLAPGLRKKADLALMAALGCDEERFWTLLQGTFGTVAEFLRFGAETMKDGEGGQRD